MKTINDARILITKVRHETVYAALVNDRLFALLRESDGVQKRIFTGRVENIVPNLQAAFVRFTEKDTGFLQFRDVPDNALTNREYKRGEALRSGDILAVMEERPASANKQARLTGFVSLSGSFTVLTFGKHGLGCSKRIDKDTTGILTDKVRRALSKDERFDKSFLKERGLILRTEAAPLLQNKDGIVPLIEEAAALEKNMRKILADAATRTAGNVLYAADSDALAEERLTRLLHSVNAAKELAGTDPAFPVTVVTDEEALFAKISESSLLSAHPELRLTLHETGEGMGLAAAYDLENKLEALTQRIVHMKSGAFLVIDETEAMTVIDVNTGKNTRSGDRVFLQVNLEAAEEALRQIRLRAFTGIIVIDLINMNRAEDILQVESALKRHAGLDTAHTRFVDFTALGIAELTRSEV